MNLRTSASPRRLTISSLAVLGAELNLLRPLDAKRRPLGAAWVCTLLSRMIIPFFANKRELCAVQAKEGVTNIKQIEV